MPALQALNRRWHVASDDIPIFVIPAFIFHLSWCIVMFSHMYRMIAPVACRGAEEYLNVGRGTLLIFTLSLVVEGLMIREGLKGNPLETLKRKRMPLFIYLHYIGTLGGMTLAAYGTYLLYVVHSSSQCVSHERQQVWNIRPWMKAWVWTTWTISLLDWLMVLLAFNIWPEYRRTRSWERRFQCLAVLLGCAPAMQATLLGRKPPLRRIAKLMSHFFLHVDFTPSDVTTAILLVAAAQRLRRRQTLMNALRLQELERLPAVIPEGAAADQVVIVPDRNVDIGTGLALRGDIETPAGEPGAPAGLLGSADDGAGLGRPLGQILGSHMSALRFHDVISAAHGPQGQLAPITRQRPHEDTGHPSELDVMTGGCQPVSYLTDLTCTSSGESAVLGETARDEQEGLAHDPEALDRPSSAGDEGSLVSPFLQVQVHSGLVALPETTGDNRRLSEGHGQKQGVRVTAEHRATAAATAPGEDSSSIEIPSEAPASPHRSPQEPEPSGYHSGRPGTDPILEHGLPGRPGSGKPAAAQMAPQVEAIACTSERDVDSNADAMSDASGQTGSRPMGRVFAALVAMHRAARGTPPATSPALLSRNTSDSSSQAGPSDQGHGQGSSQEPQHHIGTRICTAAMEEAPHGLEHLECLHKGPPARDKSFVSAGRPSMEGTTLTSVPSHPSKAEQSPSVVEEHPGTFLAGPTENPLSSREVSCAGSQDVYSSSQNDQDMGAEGGAWHGTALEDDGLVSSLTMAPGAPLNHSLIGPPKFQGDAAHQEYPNAVRDLGDEGDLGTSYSPDLSDPGQQEEPTQTKTSFVSISQLFSATSSLESQSSISTAPPIVTVAPTSGPLSASPSLWIHPSRQITLMRPLRYITPTGLVEAFKGDLDTERAVQAFAGERSPVAPGVLAEALHYINYSLAIYGAVYGMQTYLYDNPLTRFVLGRQLALKADIALRHGLTSTSDWLNYRWAVKTARLAQDEDLVYINFENAVVGSLPYMVAVDRTTQSVVVAIRGTLTLQDCITDILCEPVKCKEWLPQEMQSRLDSLPEEVTCHGGILAAANTILNDLRKTNVLGALLRGEKARSRTTTEGGTTPQSRGMHDQHWAAHRHDPGGYRCPQHVVGSSAGDRGHFSGQVLDPMGGDVPGMDAMDPFDQGPFRTSHMCGSAVMMEEGRSNKVSSLKEPLLDPEDSGLPPGHEAHLSPTTPASLSQLTNRARPKGRRLVGWRRAMFSRSTRKSTPLAHVLDAPPSFMVKRSAKDIQGERGEAPPRVPKDTRGRDGAPGGKAGQHRSSSGHNVCLTRGDSVFWSHNAPREVVAPGSRSRGCTGLDDTDQARDIDGWQPASDIVQQVEDITEAGEVRKTANYIEPELVGEEGPNRGVHDCRGWRLVVTGHSLGAGAAALLAIKLREEFGDAVHCWCFSPPGGLMSQALSQAVSEYCTSVICGKDIIGRLSLMTLERLRDEMITSLARSRYSKARVLLGSVSHSNRLNRAGDVLLPYQEIPLEAKLVLDAYHEGVRARGQAIELYPPGRVVFLQPLKREVRMTGRWWRRLFTTKMRQQERYFKAVWVEPEELMSEGILMSRHLLNDHYPGLMIEILQELSGKAEEERG